MTNNNKILTTSIIAITVLAIGLSNSAFADHQPNHNPGGAPSDALGDILAEIDNLWIVIGDLQDQIDDIITGETIVPTNWSDINGIPADIADGDDVNDADSDPTNEINPQIGGTRNLIGDGGGTAQIDCLIGEIKLYAGSHVPSGFIPAHGQILNIDENFNLYAILLTNYGGDGRVTFGIPDFRSVEPNDVGGSQNDNAHYIICADGILPLPPQSPT